MVTEKQVEKAHAQHTGKAGAAEESSALGKDPVPMFDGDAKLGTTPPILSIGDPFLKAGNIAPGITLPTGAVWQPALWLFGSYSTSAGYFDNGVTPSREYWSNRLDLFLNLKLSPTERVLLGFSPLSTGANHTGFQHTTGGKTEFINAANFEIRTLFFEGEFGEIFPRLAPDDNKGLDFGFSIGRQPIFFQDGVMLNDTMDAFGITRDTVMIPGVTQDLRITGIVGFNDIRRDDNKLDKDALLFGVFTETDFPISTVDVDAAFVSQRQPGGRRRALSRRLGDAAHRPVQHDLQHQQLYGRLRCQGCCGR